MSLCAVYVALMLKWNWNCSCDKCDWQEAQLSPRDPRDAHSVVHKSHLKRLAVVFKDHIQGHWNCCYSIGHYHFPLAAYNLVTTPLSCIVFFRYLHLIPKNLKRSRDLNTTPRAFYTMLMWQSTQTHRHAQCCAVRSAAKVFTFLIQFASI